MAQPYPRDLVGYGRTPPHPGWPGDARVAVQFVINYEEGGENNILHGDAGSEAFLSEIIGAQTWPGQRHMNMESLYEYGSRAGFWRLWRMFAARGLPVTVFGVATALQRNPDAVAAMTETGWEIASHGLKWIDYKDFSADEERAHLDEAIRIHIAVIGERPLGWYTGRTSENSLRLVMEEGGFLYSADSYADELPYWVEGPAGRRRWRASSIMSVVTSGCGSRGGSTSLGSGSGTTAPPGSRRHACRARSSSRFSATSSSTRRGSPKAPTLRGSTRGATPPRVCTPLSSRRCAPSPARGDWRSSAPTRTSPGVSP